MRRVSACANFASRCLIRATERDSFLLPLKESFSVSRQLLCIFALSSDGGPGIDRRSAAKTLLCNNNDFHLRPMCIIFGMIERNVACCHASLRPYGLVRARAREREIGAPASLRREEGRCKREKCSVLTNDSSSNDCSQNERLPHSRSTSFSFVLFSTYYLFSPNSRRSPSSVPFVLVSSPNLFFLPFVFLFVSRGRGSRWKCHRHRRRSVRSPTPHDDAHFHEIVPTYTNFGATWWHGR